MRSRDSPNDRGIVVAECRTGRIAPGVEKEGRTLLQMQAIVDGFLSRRNVIYLVVAISRKGHLIHAKEYPVATALMEMRRMTNTGLPRDRGTAMPADIYYPLVKIAERERGKI